MTMESSNVGVTNFDGFVADDWKSRIIDGRATGTAVAPPAWLDASYETLREQVMHPEYPCFFGTMAEKRGEMFYAFVNGKDIGTLPATMQTFAELASLPQYRKNNIAVFFEPDAQPLAHDTYHDLFWNILQSLHNVDPDPGAADQPEPSHEDWEFSFAGVQMFVVCACPSFNERHSRNLGPGMVLLFQPRSVFVDTITNKVIGREARNQVRKRLETWDDVSAHPDLGFYGDPGNLEWKQYFLSDDNTAAADRCPFLRRQKEAAVNAPAQVSQVAHAAQAPHASPALQVLPVPQVIHAPHAAQPLHGHRDAPHLPHAHPHPHAHVHAQQSAEAEASHAPGTSWRPVVSSERAGAFEHGDARRAAERPHAGALDRHDGNNDE